MTEMDTFNMKLYDLINRQRIPYPWVEGEKIPWNDPAFSQRMLQEHLSQEHDAASRRFETIDRHVEWIHHQILSTKSAHILDLGCGPGLYTSRLARVGHTCVGIDFSPASIQFAREYAVTETLPCSYYLEDIRHADYGGDYSLVMFIFGEFNVFHARDARLILEKSYHALLEDGNILLEVSSYSAVQRLGEEPPSWYSKRRGLFSDRPHILLKENFWEAQSQLTTERYYVIDGLTAGITRYASSSQAYSNERYQSLLEECGFTHITFYASLTGMVDPLQSDYIVIHAQKRALKRSI